MCDKNYSKSLRRRRHLNYELNGFLTTCAASVVGWSGFSPKEFNCIELFSALPQRDMAKISRDIDLELAVSAYAKVISIDIPLVKFNCLSRIDIYLILGNFNQFSGVYDIAF